MTTPEKYLFELIQERCLIQKDVVLSSAERSSTYLDLRLISCDPRGANLIGEVLYRRTCSLSIFDAIGGMACGAIPLVTATAVAYGRNDPLCRPIGGFYVRPEAKSHGTGKQIEGSLRWGDRVILLEDVATSGSSLVKAVRTVFEHGAAVVGAVALVDRQQGATEALRSIGVRLDAVFKLKDFGGEAT